MCICLYLNYCNKLKIIPWQGSKFTGNLDDFMKAAKEAYKDIDAKVVLKFPGKNGRIVQKNLTPLEALEEIKKR